MTANTFAPENLQWVGVAAETTYGTPTASPTLFVPADTPSIKNTIVNLTDTALRGSMGGEFQQVKGLRYDEVTFKTNFYLDSVFFFFRTALGLPDVMTGSADPYTHKTSLQSGSNGQPQSTTLFYTDASGKTWQMPGAQLSDLKVTISDSAFATLEVTYMGLPSTLINPPANTPTTAVPMPSWNSTITVGGTAFTKYSEISLEIKRDTKMIPTITGTQAPFAIYCGVCTVSGSFTGVYQGATDTDVLANLNNTQPVLLVSTAPVGNATHALSIQMSKVAYDDAAISGSTWMEVKSTIKGLTNPTDAAGSGGMSPMLVTLTSPQSTAF